MLPWVKAPSLAILRWFESTKFSESSPCPDVLAVVAYRAAMAVGEAHKWGRRNFAKHCAISDFRARKIIAEASDSEDGPTTGIQKPTTDQPPASKSIPRASQGQPKESHDTAVSEASISHSHPADQPPASKSIPPTNHGHPLRARVLDQKRDEDGEETQEQKEDKTPQPPKGADVVSLFDDVDVPSKRTRSSRESAPMPDRVTIRDDSSMWFQVWPSLTKSEQARIWEAVELWDKFTDVFQRVKVATLADVRAMLQIRSTGLYTLDDLHEAVQGIFVMASEKRGQWVYSSGAYLPRKLFATGGKLEEGRQVWAKVTGDRNSKTDDLGRMQHGFTMSEHDFFYGPGGKR